MGSALIVVHIGHCFFCFPASITDWCKHSVHHSPIVLSVAIKLLFVITGTPTIPIDSVRVE